MRYRFPRFPGGKSKAVTFSYDDGVTHDIRLAQICNRFNIKCTFNLNAAWIANENGTYKMSSEEIQEHILDAGHEIAVHGNYHKALGLCSTVDGIKDVLDCRIALEQKFNRMVRGMAYADTGITYMTNGAEYSNIRRYLQDLGILYSRTLGGDNDLFRLPADWYAWMPTAHHKNPNIFNWIDAFLALNPDEGYADRRYPRLFYLWGHSYEFNNDQNWDRLETICEKLGGHDDIWYATNMEIREYLQAYDSLVFSADTTKVYNPTLMTVCFIADGNPYTVEPGQTIVIK